MKKKAMWTSDERSFEAKETASQRPGVKSTLDMFKDHDGGHCSERGR